MDANTSGASLTIAEALQQLPAANEKRFATVFQHGSLLIEIYAPQGQDLQQPHSRDEVYFVASGTGEFVFDESRKRFGPSDLLFAAAGVPHRFENFSEDFVVWVMFYGPEGGEG